MKADLFLKESLSKTLVMLSEKNERVMISDLYVRLNSGDRQIIFQDDEEQTIYSCKLQPEWVEEFSDQEQYIAFWNRLLVDKMVAEQFQLLDVLRPFSVILLDENGDYIEELFCMDDDKIALNNPYIKELDEELDEFLKQIMEE